MPVPVFASRKDNVIGYSMSITISDSFLMNYMRSLSKSLSKCLQAVPCWFLDNALTTSTEAD